MTSQPLPRLPDRPKDGHKGTFGRVLIVGGSRAMAGAPMLSGRSALRTGSGLVQLAHADLAHAGAIAFCPELIGLPDAERVDAIVEAAKQADAVAVGPGWGQADENATILDALFALDGATLVVDADGLNLLAKKKSFPSHAGRLVLTPHPGEMKRLAEAFGLGGFDAKDDASRRAIASKLSKLGDCIVLLKGSRTVVVEGDRAFVNTTGDSSLSKAGTGDVLTGAIASLIGQGMSPFEAACLGAHVHGRAGELAGARLGPRSVLASDVIDALPIALRELESV